MTEELSMISILNRLKAKKILYLRLKYKCHEIRMRFQNRFSPTVNFETNNKQHDHVSKFYAAVATVVPPNLGKKGI